MNIAFQKHIADPLSSAVGDTLAEVGYWILECDREDFLADRSNAIGLAAIRLRFGSNNLEITWNWETALRPGNGAYHIHVARGQERELAGLWNTESLSLVSATEAVPWRGIIGEALQSAEVLGLDESPQAIRFVFTSLTIVVTTGYSGNALRLGDGDELLVFSERDWAAQTGDGTQHWQRLWSASAAVRPALAGKG